ncbi:hypothetical protein IWX90DRAFT_23319 [Phyllosticta citrichinensis]|uniref:Uncharacterized protein n=1 Tax=Phyllosticta citrichinensis TaxID=1130410 RepID=A0ABR1Y6T2_9PEZI
MTSAHPLPIPRRRLMPQPLAPYAKRQFFNAPTLRTCVLPSPNIWWTSVGQFRCPGSSLDVLTRRLPCGNSQPGEMASSRNAWGCSWRRQHAQAGPPPTGTASAVATTATPRFGSGLSTSIHWTWKTCRRNSFHPGPADAANMEPFQSHLSGQASCLLLPSRAKAPHNIGDGIVTFFMRPTSQEMEAYTLSGAVVGSSNRADKPYDNPAISSTVIGRKTGNQTKYAIVQDSDVHVGKIPQPMSSQNAENESSTPTGVLEQKKDIQGSQTLPNRTAHPSARYMRTFKCTSYIHDRPDKAGRIRYEPCACLGNHTAWQTPDSSSSSSRCHHITVTA